MQVKCRASHAGPGAKFNGSSLLTVLLNGLTIFILMELDVHITRDGDEPWGFEFVGGADCHIPLTIDKVVLSSAAHAAGLQAGDVVARLGDRLAAELSQHEALEIVAESVASLSLGIYRGLYDPVLDDFEPIYESNDRADSDQRSEPTEVYQDLSLDDPNILDPNITDASLWDSGYATRPLTDTRSLTASPFVPNTKPYRPFSTEPLEVPPLGNPIILNSNYRDNGDLKGISIALDPEDDDLLRLLPLDKGVEVKFKLPVSEKYDPGWNKKVKAMLGTCADGEKRDNHQVEHELVYCSNKSETSTDVTNIKVVQNMKDIKEFTVQENGAIENKVIKKVTTFDEMKREFNAQKLEQLAFEVVEESIERAVSVTEDIQKEIEDEKASIAKELQMDDSETISEMKIQTKKLGTKEEMKELASKSQMTEAELPTRNEVSRKASNAKEIKSEQHASEFESSGISTETSKSEGKEKSYMIDLQTIPHIKGFVQSSHHFDLLLRTFFVHLTDVMVALSRFILTQPTHEPETKAENVVKEKLIKEFFEKDNIKRKETEHKREEIIDIVQSVKDNKLQEKDMRQDTKAVQCKQEFKTAECKTQHEYKERQQVKHEIMKSEQVTSQNLVLKQQEDVENDMEDLEVRKKSGAEMAQRTQRKSRDLTRKMDAVITEFENKTGIEDGLEIAEQTSRRSRSRSQIEEEVMRESDPLEWLDKVDSRRASQERICTTVEKGFSSYSESKENQKSETKCVSRTTKVKPGKQMYIGIVQAHVYTNEDAIFEDAVEFVEEPFETTKEVLVKTKSNQQKAISKLELHTAVAAETTEITERNESKIESFKAKEVTSNQAVISSEENYKAAAESITDMILESCKEATTEFKVKEHQAVSKVESLAIAVAESTDAVEDDSKVETFGRQQLVSKKALIKSEEKFRTAAAGVTEIAFETAEDMHSERAKTNEVIIKDQAQHLAVAGIIETKSELCKEPKKLAEDEYASLKIVKEQIIDGGESVEMSLQSDLNVKRSLEVDISSSHLQESSSVQETSVSKQESHKSAKSLFININLAQNLDGQISDQSDGMINTPSPSTVPTTPLTDEYVFRLEIPLPKNQGTVIIEDSPDREDPNIVKKGLVPYIETTIEDQIIYDPPLPTPPPGARLQSPVYTKPGLKGGAAPLFKKEYIREIERKSSLLASAIDQTIKSIEEYKEDVGIHTKNDVTMKLSKKPKGTIQNGVTNGHEVNGLENEFIEEMKESTPKYLMNGTDGAKESDELPGFKPVVFNPEAYQARLYEEVIRGIEPAPVVLKLYVDESGEPLGTVQGIVDGLDDATVDEEVARELGKPGMTEDKIAELISGETEMLREAHVMGLSRVLSSHMTRPDDSSVDFQKIKPLYESLKDSEVLKALNEEMKRENEEKKKEEKNWTTFLQKPKRPVPRVKFGYNGQVEMEEVEDKEPYKVKIVKQPKPKVAPDYKPEDFETGPLPWEQRALIEPVPSPVPPEEPILVPGEAEFFEAVDPLPETEVPDLEDTGIPLPPTPPPEIPTDLPPEPQAPDLLEPEPEVQVEEPPPMPVMDQNAMMAEQLVNTVKSMVDPKAPLEQQLIQMRAQLAALAQLPCVIQQSLELLTRQLFNMGRQETHQKSQQEIYENNLASIQEYKEELTQNYQVVEQNGQEGTQKERQNTVTIEEVQEKTPMMMAEETAALKKQQDAMIEEQRKIEKEKKERQEIVRLDQESRQVKQRAPRVGKPRSVFGPLNPEDRPQVLPGGRRWRGPKDAYDEQMIAETLQAQSELIQGKVMGYESERLPYDNSINFKKYEKPPVNLDHLQSSATYRLVHNMEDAPLKQTDLRTPVICEADYRERCRSATPNMANGRM